MATIDIILIVLIIVSSLFGLIRGLIASTLSFIGWILSFYLTFITFPLLEPYLETKIGNPFMLKVFGYSILLVVYLIIFGIINLALNLATQKLRGNIFNRSFGLIFGFARGILLVMIALLVYHINFTALHGMSAMENSIEDQTPEFYKEGMIASKIAKYTNKTKRIFPNSTETKIVEFYDRLTNSSLEERFVEYAIMKIERNLDMKIKSKIRDKLNTREDELDKQELDLLNLKLSYSEYNNLDFDSLTNPLNDDEIDRIDSIVLGIETSSMVYEDIEDVE